MTLHTTPLRDPSLGPPSCLRNPSSKNRWNKRREALRNPSVKASVGPRASGPKTPFPSAKRPEMHNRNQRSGVAEAGNLSGSVDILLFVVVKTGVRLVLEEVEEKMGEGGKRLLEECFGRLVVEASVGEREEIEVGERKKRGAGLKVWFVRSVGDFGR